MPQNTITNNKSQCMRHFIFLIIQLVTFTCFSQEFKGLDYENYSPKIGDKIKSYMAKDASALDIKNWDFSNIKLEWKPDTTYIFERTFGFSIFNRKENSTIFQHNDSLYISNFYDRHRSYFVFENRPFHIYPITSQTKSMQYSARGTFDNETPVKLEGIYTENIDYTGLLITPDKRIFKKSYRVKCVDKYTAYTQNEDNEWQVYCKDNIITKYEWYVPGNRYPILVYLEILCTDNEKNLYDYNSYLKYIPIPNDKIVEETNEDIKLNPYINTSTKIIPKPKFTDNNLPILNYSNTNKLLTISNITFTNTKIYINTANGTLLYNVDSPYETEYIYFNEYPAGTYIVCVEIDYGEKIITEKIVVK